MIINGQTIRKRYRYKTSAFILFSLISGMVISQESNFGNWFVYFGNKQINTKWNWHNEIQHRNYNAIGDLEQLLLRTGVGHNLTEGNNNVLMGYAYVKSKNYVSDILDKTDVQEHRIFQQFITRQAFGRFRLQHRYRFEQRFIEDNFSMRLRYFLGLNIPINNKDMVEKTWYVSTYNEIFLNMENPIFDRNRLYGGLGYGLNKNTRFEIGYMNQIFSVGGRDQLNLITFVNF